MNDKATPWERAPLTVMQAQKSRVCRFCQEDDHARGPDNPFLLHYGSEYAHKKCVEKANELGSALPLPVEMPWEHASEEIRKTIVHPTDSWKHDTVQDIIERACREHAAALQAELDATNAAKRLFNIRVGELQAENEALRFDRLKLESDLIDARTQLAEQEQTIAKLREALACWFVQDNEGYYPD